MISAIRGGGPPPPPFGRPAYGNSPQYSGGGGGRGGYGGGGSQHARLPGPGPSIDELPRVRSSDQTEVCVRKLGNLSGAEEDSNSIEAQHYGPLSKFK